MDEPGDSAGGADLIPRLPADDEWLREKAALIGRILRRTADEMVQLGRELLEVRNRIDHGLWETWVKQTAGLSKTGANRFIQMALTFDETFQVGTFEPAALNILIQPGTPKAALELAKKLSDDGRQITGEAARNILKEVRPGPAVTPPRGAIEAHQAKKTASGGVEAAILSLFHNRSQIDDEARIEIQERLDPDGNPIYVVKCRPHHEESRSLAEAFLLLAAQVSAVPTGPPAVDPSLHRQWAILIGRGVANEYSLKGDDIEEIEAAAVLQMTRACHRFNREKVKKETCKVHRRDNCEECQFRGWAHLDVRKYCQRESHLPRNGGMYRTRRDPKGLVVGRFEEEGGGDD